jgi:uncharacterized protein YidB (DUF937 family)
MHGRPRRVHGLLSRGGALLHSSEGVEAMAGLEEKIEGGLSSVLGKDVDMPSWLTPVLTGLVGAIGRKAVGGAVGGDAGGGLGAVLGGLLGGAAGSGALTDILGKFTGAGAKEQADSWVGTGENQPVDAATVEKALGPDAIAKIAEQTGKSTQEVEEGLATALPKLVDAMTPEGQLPDDESLNKAISKVASQQ